MTDIRTLVCGNREIKWLLTRKKVKNINMRIKSDGIVYISANTRVTIGFIENFIREKADFIFSALDRFSEREKEPELPEKDTAYKSGDILRYFGENYTLNIELSSKESVFLSGREIVVRARSEERTGKLLEKFYAEEIGKLFQSLNDRTYEMFLAKGYNVPKAALQIRQMRSRWGSCHITDGKIVMNSRLALYPEMCSAYVFIHEYAHFIVPNHSKAFYSVVYKLMPDYKICVDILKR
ncbi:MAG: M48 family metallopeptidase [Oscillospiraceae bacterium]